MLEQRPKKFSKELAGAVAEEQRHQAIDAAKKKAVAQHADYDTFKKMVSVAHLKPLHAPGSHGPKGSLPAWQLDPHRLGPSTNSITPGITSKAAAISDGHEHIEQVHKQPSTSLAAAAAAPSTAAAPHTAVSCLPRTSQEFAREWRKHCPTPADKYSLLKLCGPQALAQLFRVEVEALLLGQILQVMQQQWRQPSEQQQHQQQQQQQQPPQHADAMQGNNMVPDVCQSCAGARADDAAEAVEVLHMLQSLAGAGRFDLNVRLLDRSSKAAAAALCSQLQEVLQQAAAAAAASGGPAEPQNSTSSSGSTQYPGAQAMGGAVQKQHGTDQPQQQQPQKAEAQQQQQQQQQQQPHDVPCGTQRNVGCDARKALEDLQTVIKALRL